MPQLTFKSIPRQNVIDMSKALVDELEVAIGCPREYFTLEHVDSVFIKDGSIAPDYPLVFVALFDRGEEVQDKVAQIITDHVQRAGYPNVDVIFTLLERSRYYENGVHF